MWPGPLRGLRDAHDIIGIVTGGIPERAPLTEVIKVTSSCLTLRQVQGRGV